MRLLIIGDIVGRPGKHACSQIVPRLVRDREIDCVTAIGENAAAGSGLTRPTFTKLRHQGVDLMTMGDHIYKRLEICTTLETSDRIVKPANLPREAAGRDFAIATTKRGAKVAVISVLG